MRIIGTLLAAMAVAALATSVSKAQTSDLIGTWTAEATVIMKANDKIVEVPNQLMLVIESVNGLVLRGTRTWKSANDVRGYIDDKSFLEATEPFIGALSQDGKNLRMVEVDDQGMMFATRIGDDALEFTYMEAAPHPIAYTAIFRRKE